MPRTKRKVKTDVKVTNISRDMTTSSLKEEFLKKLKYNLSKDSYSATLNNNFWAMAYAIRDRIIDRWIETQQSYHTKNVKRVYYLSLEFLIGRLFGNYAFNLGLEKQVEAALKEFGMDLEDVREQEVDAGLGNGGLGRLAACFLDSMATLGIPAHGYGIRYDYGIFNQKIIDGHQVERPDRWLRQGNPWEFPRLEYTCMVKFYGKTEMQRDSKGHFSVKWVDTQDVLATPYDMPIPGYKNDIVNTLRLWSASSTEEFDLEYFNTGDYEQAVQQKVLSENISKVLYPNDGVSQGKELRLKQEYFFTAASIFDIIRRYKSENDDMTKLPEKVAIQLNDTHPALAILELMHVLIDDYELHWDVAWGIVRQVFAYTNHTLMPEALEKWSVDLFERVLPRHLQILYEINTRFLDEISDKFPGDDERLGRMSLIEEGFPKKARMAYLSIVGSHSINGVSALHSELIKKHLFKDFYEFYPEKFNNKTNGITQRRWLLKSNTGLSNLITESIGDKWVTELTQLGKLEKFKDNKAFQKKWQDIKYQNKVFFSEYAKKWMNLSIDPNFMFDVQVKRLHEYKRQLLFGLYIISQYLTIKNDPQKFTQPRIFLIGGKAAPGYHMAKLIIKMLNNISGVIGRDKNVRDKIQLFFLENYRVSLAEKIFPASDLSEQISTAGTEASGTGNMKFMLNGALTIGTLDGANVEMHEVLGDDNIFIFGKKTEEVEEIKRNGYNPQEYINKSPMLSEIFKLLKKNFFCSHNPGLFDPIVNSLLDEDRYLLCADFDSYCAMQDEVSKQYMDKELWTKKSIINVAKSGIFSSDRTIKQYNDDIWKC